jgi:predicted RNA-binding Zn-ribbon protein involved in translation (DUF1610 family)
MAIHCPKCGEEITELRAFVKAERVYDVSLLNAELDWYERDVYSSEVDAPDFECPECNELLFHDEEQVIKFLQWGDLYPWKGVDDYGQGKDKET